MDINPKDAIGIRRTGAWYVSKAFIYGVGIAMLEGARKYSGHGYRVAPVRASVYCTAAQGHIDQFSEGEDDDPESRLNHLLKAAASLAVLYDAYFNGMMVDDRPPKLKDGWKKRFDDMAGWVIDNVQPDDPAVDHTELGEQCPRCDAIRAEVKRDRKCKLDVGCVHPDSCPDTKCLGAS